jgi:hypothetical protein
LSWQKDGRKYRLVKRASSTSAPVLTQAATGVCRDAESFAPPCEKNVSDEWPMVAPPRFCLSLSVCSPLPQNNWKEFFAAIGFIAGEAIGQMRCGGKNLAPHNDKCRGRRW